MTLSHLQQLYESKLITYPRTSSRYLSNDLAEHVELFFNTLLTLAESKTRHCELLRTDGGELTQAVEAIYAKLGGDRKTQLVSNKNVFNDNRVRDHHALIPTNESKLAPEAVKQEARLLYDMIVRRLVAALMDECRRAEAELVASTTASEDGLLFRGRTSSIVSPGWRTVYARKLFTPTSKATARDKPSGEGTTEKEMAKRSESDEPATEDTVEEIEGVLPTLKKGDVLQVLESNVETQETQPPPLHTEDTLLKSMETAGNEIEDEEEREAIKDCGERAPIDQHTS